MVKRGKHLRRKAVDDDAFVAESSLPNYPSYDYSAGFDGGGGGDGGGKVASFGHHSGYGHKKKLECCELVVDPLTFASLLAQILGGAAFLNVLVSMNLGRKRRRRRYVEDPLELEEILEGTNRKKLFLNFFFHSRLIGPKYFRLDAAEQNMSSQYLSGAPIS